MNFIPNTQEQLKSMNIEENQTYTIEFLDKDYFNGEETLQRTSAKAILNDDNYIFIVTDPYGMDKFINSVKVIN